MPRYIDADAILHDLENGVYPSSMTYTLAVDIAKGLIEVASEIDAVPVVRGEWIHGCTDGAGTEFCYCSACGEDALKDKGGYTEFSRYCPNCGTKMEDKPCENI